MSAERERWIAERFRERDEAVTPSDEALEQPSETVRVQRARVEEKDLRELVADDGLRLGFVILHDGGHVLKVGVEDPALLSAFGRIVGAREQIVVVVDGDGSDVVSAAREEGLERGFRLKIPPRVKKRVPEEPRRCASRCQEAPGHDFSPQHVLLELRERSLMKIEMRVGVVPELHPGLEPEGQERHLSRIFASALEDLSLVHETDRGNGTGTEMLEKRFRADTNLLRGKSARGHERKIVDGDRDAAHRLAAERCDEEQEEHRAMVVQARSLEKAITEPMVPALAAIITRRSNPRATPAHGGRPCSRARIILSSIGVSARPRERRDSRSARNLLRCSEGVGQLVIPVRELHPAKEDLESLGDVGRFALALSDPRECPELGGKVIEEVRPLHSQTGLDRFRHQQVKPVFPGKGSGADGLETARFGLRREIPGRSPMRIDADLPLEGRGICLARGDPASQDLLEKLLRLRP